MKKITKSRLLLGLVCVVCGSETPAADWYVDAALSSPGPGSSWASALRSIQDAVDAAAPGETVRVAPGTYGGTVFMKDGVHLVGAGFQVTRIVGGSIGCVVRGASRCRIEGFTIQGDGEDDVDGIRAEGARDFHVIHNYIEGHSWSGIAGIHSCMQVIGNVIVSNRVAGVFLEGESPEPSRIEHNTICGNLNEAGLNIWRNAKAVAVHNIIVGNTGSGGICCVEGGQVELRRNDVFGNSCLSGPPRNYVGCLAGDGDLAVDPAFADPTGGDYRLRRGSPCIDAAMEPAPDNPLLTQDLLGVARSADGNGNGLASPDLGALETEPLRLMIRTQPEARKVQLAWNSLPGETYRLLVSPSLLDSPWSEAARITSAGDVTVWSEPQAADNARWYRVAADPLR